MLQLTLRHPRTVLMTLDAVGGVWRYGMDLASALRQAGIGTIFLGFGPEPGHGQRREAERLGRLIWSDLPLDWTTDDLRNLETVPETIRTIAEDNSVDLIHLNLPSQAAGLETDIPVVVVCHSCVVSWFRAVRKSPLPDGWTWQETLNRAGLDRADAIIVPSQSHAELVALCYGDTGELAVVPNATRVSAPREGRRDAFAYAAARWWDEGKNAAVLDAAAALMDWPVLAAGATHGPGGQSFAFAHVEALGEIGHESVEALGSKAGLFISPSLYEPFGLATLEAAQAGAALILSDIPTYRELWDGVALFAPPENPTAFAEAANRLSDDAALRQRLGRGARDRAARYSIEAQANAIAEIYASALTRQSGRES